MAQLWKLEQEEASSASGRHPAPCTKCSHNWNLPLLHPIGLSAAQFKGGRSQKECTLEPRPWQSGGHVCKATVGSKEAEILAVCSVSKITRAKRVNLLFFLSTLFKKFWDKVLHWCSSCWPWAHRDSPAPTSQVLVLRMRATTPKRASSYIELWMQEVCLSHWSYGFFLLHHLTSYDWWFGLLSISNIISKMCF